MTRAARFARCALAALALAHGLAAPAARAQDAPLTDAEAKQLFNTAGCNACHAVDEMRIGPPYRAVALRYAGAPSENVDWLATKILVGGAGSWGSIPMVSNPRLSARDARAAARWILALASAEASGTGARE
jgi:cytochrome c